jgi:hypothetical protein
MHYLTRALSVAAVAAFTAFPVFAADCAQPGEAPIIPDGTTATVDQLKTAHEAVQSYVRSLESFQDCVEARIKMLPKAKPEELQKLRDAGNAAIDQAKSLSDNYSAQVKIFKARPPK